MQVVKLKLEIIFTRFSEPLYAYVNVSCKIIARTHFHKVIIAIVWLCQGSL